MNMTYTYRERERKKERKRMYIYIRPPTHTYICTHSVLDVTDALLALKGEPKEQRSWKAIRKILGKDESREEFITYLKGLKQIIDAGQLPDKNVLEAREYLALEHVRADVMLKCGSTAAAAFCDFLINIVAYEASQKCC